MNKKAIGISAAGLITLAASFVGVQALMYASNADQTRLRAMVPEVTYEVGSSSVFSAEHDADIKRLYNQIGRELVWSDEDRDWIAGIIGSSWPDIEVDPESDTYEAWDLFSATITIIGERIGTGISTDPEIVKLYRLTVVDMLLHPQGRVRQKGVTGVANAGMLEEPALVAALERMAEYDSHEGTRRAARIKLEQHRGIETERDDCPTCPGGQP